MARSDKNFWQRHPGFDLYSLFWFLLFLLFAALGRFFLPLLIPAAVALGVIIALVLRIREIKKGEVDDAKQY